MITNKRCWLLVGTRLIITLALQTVIGVAVGDASEPLLSSSYSFVVVEIPDASGRLGFTSLADINDKRKLLAGLTAGPRGFLFDRFELTEIQCPSAVAATAARSINQGGDIAGFCLTSSLHGFLRHRDGDYVFLDFPRATLTEASGLNDDLQVVGDYRDSTGRFHGFVWDDGLFLTIDVPFPEAQDSAPSGVNNVGQIVGFYHDRDFHTHGYLYDGSFTPFDFPDAISTDPIHINDQGQIVGRYVDSAGLLHGFLLDNGAFTTIDAPFPGVIFTEAWGINNRGQIVGRFFDSALGSRGFVATPNEGSGAVPTAPAQLSVTSESQVVPDSELNQIRADAASTIGRLPRASWFESGSR